MLSLISSNEDRGDYGIYEYEFTDYGTDGAFYFCSSLGLKD